MTVLDFIRKNSILVLIVIAAVALGLIMMDYSGKGSMFSNDYYIQVDGTNYDYPETEYLGANGKEYLASLAHHTQQRMVTNFDADGNGELSDEEAKKAEEWMMANPQLQQSLDFINAAYRSWGSQVVPKADSVNFAISRALLHAEAKALGINPSKEQVDAFILSLPAFTKTDGSFDLELYRRMVGYRNGTTDNAQEKAFRGVIADLITWQCLRSMMTDGLTYNFKATSAFIDSLTQKVIGKTAWLPASAAGEPAEPTEDELKAYWEQNKARYKSEERRIVSVYTLTPAEGSTLEALLDTADIIMQDLSLADGKGLDDLLARSAENPELSPFTYLDAEGKSHVTLPLSPLSDLPEALRQKVVHNGSEISLGEAAFSVEVGPAVAEYEQAAKAGKADKLASIKHVRGFFPTEGGKLVLVRVEAIERPETLSFELARDKALADLRQERKDNALELKAKEMYAAMEACLGAEGGVTAAFDKAAEMGAEVTSFGPLAMDAEAELPEGLDLVELRRTHSGRLAPLVVLPTGARVSCVTDRTVENNPETRQLQNAFYLMQLNGELADYVFFDWHREAIGRYKVLLNESITRQDNAQ